jgi:hypothetical protein
MSVYPECGYFFNGGLVYLACLCGSVSLCPIGQPTTCAQAAALLQSNNEGTACAEANNNRCTGLTSGMATTDATTIGTTASDAGSGCDETCYSSCAGEPDCIQLCGC